MLKICIHRKASHWGMSKDGMKTEFLKNKQSFFKKTLVVITTLAMRLHVSPVIASML